MARKIRILSVGKQHDAVFVDAISMYQQRLQSFLPISWVLIPPKTEAARSLGVASESNSILKSLKEAECVILLDEAGTMYDSKAFSSLLFDCLQNNKDVAFVIGGAYGVNDSVKKRAQYVVSFGKLVYPHQLMRVMLVEQLYRASSIQQNSSYHHE